MASSLQASDGCQHSTLQSSSCQAEHCDDIAEHTRHHLYNAYVGGINSCHCLILCFVLLPAAVGIKRRMLGGCLPHSSRELSIAAVHSFSRGVLQQLGLPIAVVSKQSCLSSQLYDDYVCCLQLWAFMMRTSSPKLISFRSGGRTLSRDKPSFAWLQRHSAQKPG